MSSRPHDSETIPTHARDFATTQWSVVLAAHGDSTRARAALTRLCELYWYPLYAFARRQGATSSDAQDLTQEFFHFLLRKNSFAVADPLRGRFRSFLLGSFKHFLANERSRAAARKRGGDRMFVTIDDATAQARYAADMSDHLTPDRIYEQQWARTVLAQALQRLRTTYLAEQRDQLFDHLKECLTAGKSSIPYTELAKRTGLTEGAVKVAVYRLRKRYREALRQTVAETVPDPGEVEAEIRALLTLV
jgi:RNA polymerase sigma-70 factor (ECF subfamily)